MSKEYENISPDLAAWIGRQKIFFVGTAPLAADGRVNVSPKGGDSLRVLSPLDVAYQDYTGSGAETVAHVRENGRIVVMLCAFEGAPKIVRLHGVGAVVLPGDARYKEFQALFPDNPGTRAFVHVHVDRVSDSCGYAVPLYDYQKNRDGLDRWAASRGPEGLVKYRAEKNQTSIDGLPAFPAEEPTA